MNVRDSEVISGLLARAGYRLTDSQKAADVVIFNTCSVREHAENKVWSAIGRMNDARPMKKIIGLAGCTANCYRDEIFRRAPAVDFVIGTRDIAKIPQVIKELTREKWRQPPTGRQGPHFLLERKIWETDGEERPEEIYHTGFHLDKAHAFVVISEGCENFCSYCVVPYTRGRLRHRSPQDIIKEIEEDIGAGITKVTLLGQNVNSYRRNGTAFIRLLEAVNKIKGLKEFSFITSHPKDTSAELFKAMADLGKLKKYLHLPVQSGSDRILKAMNRGYSRKFYLDLAQIYRKAVKGASLTTDIIVGFPGESEKDFQDTFDLVKGLCFNAAYIFKYSPRPHSQAARLPDDVPRQEKERRHRLILELQKEISKKIKALALAPLVFLWLFNAAYALDLDKIKVDILEGDYKSAAIEGEKIMADTQCSAVPDELYYLLGLSYLKEGNYLRASDIFEIIIKEFKNSGFNEEAEIGLADAYFLMGEYDKAERFYKDFISRHYRSRFRPQAFYKTALCAAKSGRTREAKEYLEKLNREYPFNIEATLEKGLSGGSEIYYTVQVGAFSSAENARNLLQELIRKGHPAYIEEAEFQGKVSWRVRVGRSRLRSEVLELENKLSREGYPTKISP